jgi:hypothetical protein
MGILERLANLKEYLKGILPPDRLSTAEVYRQIDLIAIEYKAAHKMQSRREILEKMINGELDDTQG